jgi:hypothetical protein
MSDRAPTGNIRLRGEVALADVCQSVMGMAPKAVTALGTANASNSYLLDFGDSRLKCYETESPERAKLVQQATHALQAGGIAIPRIHAVVGHVIFAEWVEGEALSWKTVSREWRGLARYQRQIHGCDVEAQVPAHRQFVHLEWLLARLERDARRQPSCPSIGPLCERIRELVPSDLEIRVVAPDFIPPNIVAAPDKGLTLVDNEFIALSAGFEFDILNTMHMAFPNDAASREKYLEEYESAGDSGTLRRHAAFWDICYRVKTAGKRFALGDSAGGLREMAHLWRQVDGYGHGQ